MVVGQVGDMGHCGTGEIPHPDTQLLQRGSRSHCCVRCHQQRVIHQGGKLAFRIGDLFNKHGSNQDAGWKQGWYYIFLNETFRIVLISPFSFSVI